LLRENRIIKVLELRVLKMSRYRYSNEKRSTEYVEFRVRIPRRLYIEFLAEALKSFGNIEYGVEQAIKLWIEVSRGKAKIVFIENR